jgi:hypothetical protein
MSFKKTSQVYPAGKYYVGDICYALSSTVYELIWGDEHNYEEGTYEATYKNNTNTFTVAHTKFGDGVYLDDIKNLEFNVDAGNIGIVPLELCNPKNIKNNSIQGGHIIESSTEIEFNAFEGIFLVTYNNNTNMIIIDTSDLGEDETSDENDE